MALKTRAVAAFLGLVIAAQAGAEQRWVYHYDPDSAPRDAGRFKAVVAAFLDGVDEKLSFQPFRRLVDFEKRLEEQRPAYLTVAHSWFRKNRERLSLKPLLLPSRRGEQTFRKVLVARSAGITVEQLAGRSVAATALDAEASFQTLLGTLKVSPKDLRVVSVTRDVDALLALAFGQVDLALVRPRSIDRLRKVNPNAVFGLRTLFTTPPVYRPPICEVGSQPKALTARLVDALRKAPKSPLGKRTLRIMGFDRWDAVPKEALQ